MRAAHSPTIVVSDQSREGGVSLFYVEGGALIPASSALSQSGERGVFALELEARFLPL